MFYGQCGGLDWTGPTCCIAGSTCDVEETAVDGSYGEGTAGGYGADSGAYSRCLPDAGTMITGALNE